MSLGLCIENDSLLNFEMEDEGHLCEVIEAIDELIQIAYSYGDSINSYIDIYYMDTIAGRSFCEWLFDFSDCSSLLREEKIILSKILEQSDKIDENMYTSIKNDIEKQSSYSPNYESENGFISFSVKSEWYIQYINQWSILHRIYLSASSNVNDFVYSMNPCFLNLYFHENVKSSLRTLNRNFSDIKHEIIEHLTGINDFYPQVKEFRKNSNGGFRELAATFKSKTGINCSPQADRRDTICLKANFRNQSGQNEELTCEMHTKFSTFNADPEKQDRLYFHPGEENIESGKILIFAIGEHA